MESQSFEYYVNRTKELEAAIFWFCTWEKRLCSCIDDDWVFHKINRKYVAARERLKVLVFG